MTRQRTFLTVTIVVLPTALCAPGTSAADAPAVTTVTHRTGAGLIYIDQGIWCGGECPAPSCRSAKGRGSHALPAAG